ncbi:hypothetical protein RB195_023913 [Necator americanus]
MNTITQIVDNSHQLVVQPVPLRLYSSVCIDGSTLCQLYASHTIASSSLNLPLITTPAVAGFSHLMVLPEKRSTSSSYSPASYIPSLLVSRHASDSSVNQSWLQHYLDAANLVDSAYSINDAFIPSVCDVCRDRLFGTHFGVSACEG